MLQSDIVIILDLSWTKFFQPSAFALEKHDTLDDDVRRDKHFFFGMMMVGTRGDFHFDIYWLESRLGVIS